MRILGLVLVFLCTFSTVWADDIGKVETRINSITDTRSADAFFAGLDIELTVTSDLIADTKSFRFSVVRAEDDRGENIPKKKSYSSGFSELDEFNKTDAKTAKFKAGLKNPSRQATQVTELVCELELFVPKRDPDAVVIIDDFAQYAGNALASAKLQKENIEITISAPKEKSIPMQIKDPGSKILTLEFQDPHGKELPLSGRMSFGSPESYQATYELRDNLPDGAKLKIYLKTEKAMIKIPIALKDIALP